MDRRPSQGFGRWYKIQNRAKGPAEITINGDIGEFGISSNDFVNDLKNLSGDLDIHLNTAGGAVFDGVTIYNALKNHQGTKTVYIDGLAASIGSVIAMAGDKIYMGPGTQMMIHEGYGVCQGDAAEMLKMSGVLDKTSESIAGFYAERTGKPQEQWRQAMKAETWFNPQEAIAAGLADGMTGQLHNHSHVQVLNAADTSPWDGSEAMSDAAKAEDPAKAYAAICAGKRSGDPDKQATWALPHHEHPDSPPNEAGVKNALARLPQTDGLTNKSEAQSHLEAHMKEINPDYESSSNHLARQISDILLGIKI